MHGIAYDATHDEVVVPVALADAVLVFRGGADGSEAPIRVIQGTNTKMIRPHTVTVDERNNEIIVGIPAAAASWFSIAMPTAMCRRSASFKALARACCSSSASPSTPFTIASLQPALRACPEERLVFLSSAVPIRATLLREP